MCKFLGDSGWHPDKKAMVVGERPEATIEVSALKHVTFHAVVNTAPGSKEADGEALTPRSHALHTCPSATLIGPAIPETGVVVPKMR